ncbi:MAG: alcohol dehydrogenase catalytic domain-containing protein, partial [Psychrobium sp.]
MIKAIIIDNINEQYQSSVRTIDGAELDEGDVQVRISYSTLNYKDALAITGKAPVVRKFPMVPGIDFVGEVIASHSEKFKMGDKVLLNGFGVGEVHKGGLAQQAQVKSDWLIHLPANMAEKNAMAIGTAGYTAMLCIMALEKAGISPESGPVLVTGATGGVGSFAVLLLNKLGYEVTASTGDPSNEEYLRNIGAKK